MNRLSVYLPLRIVTAANLREHYMAKHRRVQAERKAVDLVVRSAMKGGALPLPCRVTMTRIAPRKLDSDNLQSGMKAVRDQLADLIQANDADPRIQWIYEHEKGKPKEYGLRIVVEAA